MRDIIESLSKGDVSKAERDCRSRLSQGSGDPALRFLLAFCCWRRGRSDEAVRQARAALAAEPSDPVLLNDIGNLLRELGDAGSARDALEMSLASRPEDPGTRLNLALALDALGEDVAALELAAALGPKDPRYAEARLLVADIRQGMGEFEAAETAYRQCLELRPGMSRAWYGLVHVRRFCMADGLADELRARLDGGADSGMDRCRLLFALAKLLDDAEAFEAAAERLHEANGLVNARYDADGIERRIDALINRFEAGTWGEAPTAAPVTPVFIVGLPRSGTTLLERLLDRHPDVVGLGERNTLAGLVAPEDTPRPDSDLRGLGADYLAATPAEARKAAVITDKMPSNFWLVGHLGRMLPHARVIHVMRDARDTALSNYFRLYATGNSFAYDLGTLAHYRACQDVLASHWRKVMDERMLTLDYERLVADPAKTMAGVEAFLGLDPPGATGDDERSPRRIRTASSWQARQRVHTRSVGRWRHYPDLAEVFTREYGRFQRLLTGERQTP